jgi:hypothetical protein
MGWRQQVTGEKLLAVSFWLLAQIYAATAFLAFTDQLKQRRENLGGR